MSRFIKLTSKRNDEHHWVNADYVTIIWPNGNGGSSVAMQDCPQHESVLESPEQILAMIEGWEEADIISAPQVSESCGILRTVKNRLKPYENIQGRGSVYDDIRAVLVTVDAALAKAEAQQ